jgi:hypothetical protein
MQRKLLTSGALAAILALAACGESTTGPAGSASLSATDSQALAADIGDQNGAFLDGFGGLSFDRSVSGPSYATTVTTTFTRTRTCPAGGDVKLAGTMTHTVDPATKSGSMSFDATRTEEACAFTHNGVTVTITGNPNTHLTANQAWTNGMPGVRTATTQGSFNWSKSNGKSGTCTVNLTHTWDPATKTAHISGTFCNQTVDITRTWTQS